MNHEQAPELEPIIERVVGHVVDSALQRSGGDYGFVDVKRWIAIEKAWKPSLEGFITDRVAPVGYRRGVIYVACRSAAMEQELVYIKDLILTKLRTALPGIPLEDIRATLKAKVQKKPSTDKGQPTLGFLRRIHKKSSTTPTRVWRAWTQTLPKGCET